MNNIDTYILNPRSIFTDYHCYSIAPDCVIVSVLETSVPYQIDTFTYTVIDSNNKTIFPSSASNPIDAIKDYIDAVNGKVIATDKDDNEKETWASNTIHISQIKDEWEIMDE